MIDTFLCFTEWAESFKYLTVEQKARLLDLIFDFAATGECPEVEDAALNIVFGTIRRSITYTRQKYEETVEKRREAGRKGGLAPRKQSQANESKCLPSQANEPYTNNDTSSCTCSFSSSSTATDGYNDDVTCPPAYEEVEAFVIDNGINIDPVEFYEYYDEMDWRTVKGRPIVDWRAAVKNWERRQSEW